jgi:8-oxo-dGTP diphosphatase
MIPRWFTPDMVPFEQMWQDSSHWLPPVLRGMGVRARFSFRPDNETILDLEMETWPMHPGNGS